MTLLDYLGRLHKSGPELSIKLTSFPIHRTCMSKTFMHPDDCSTCELGQGTPQLCKHCEAFDMYPADHYREEAVDCGLPDCEDGGLILHYRNAPTDDLEKYEL